MTNSYFNSSGHSLSRLYDGRWKGPSGDVLVEVKRTSNARDVRDALLELTYALAGEPSSSQALCLLVRSRLTPDRLSEELSRFRSVMRPDFAARVMLARMDDQDILFSDLTQADDGLRDYLKVLAQKELNASGDRVSRDAVKAYVANLWLQGHKAQTQASLQRETGASLPTVTTALRELDQQELLQTGSKGAKLREPTWDGWRRFAESYGNKRTSIRFADPSGLSRSPIDMFTRLTSLQKRGIAETVAIGGVVGATHYYPDLDITAPPRLDLTVFDGDTSFVKQLDAGLVVSERKDAKAVLVVHTTSGGERFVETSSEGRFAPPLDCLADLLEVGLAVEARDFAFALNQRAKSKHKEELNKWPH